MAPSDGGRPAGAGPRDPSAPPNLSRLLLAGAALVVLGLAIAGIAPVRGTDVREDQSHLQSIAGGFLVLAGWGFLGFGIHRFGRAGEESRPG